MAYISISPLDDDQVTLPCETPFCVALAKTRCEQQHTDDGESWYLCREHSFGFVLDTMDWVINDGDVLDPDFS